MNVVFVNATRRWGGVKTWTLDVAEQLTSFGHGVTIVCRPGPFAQAARQRGIGCVECDFGMDFSPRLIFSFLRLLRKLAADVVVANVGKDMRTAAIAARLLGIPVVQRVGLPRDMRDVFKVRLVHRFVRPRILVPCDYIRDGLLGELPFLSPGEVTVIRTGKRPAPTPPRSVHTPRRLVVTSQLNPDKGHADLFRALAALAGKGFDFSLTVCGTGGIESELRELAARLGIGERVTFTGFVTDIRASLREADIFVLPSLTEGLPNTLLEAMAEGLVPVARDVGGVAEVWPPELAGCLVRGPGPEPFIPALMVLLAAPEDVVLSARRAAWEQCRAEFDLDAQARKLEQWLAVPAAPRV